MINWPYQLVKDIAARKCVLFLGSGISANSVNKKGRHPATWKKFIEDILESKKEKLSHSVETVRKLLIKEDYLTACEVIVDILGEREFGELAANEFRRPGYTPNELHDTIFSLDSKIVITPNVDKIYDQFATINSNGTIIIKTYMDDIAQYLRSPDYLIIKAHGTVDDTSHIIFTHGQYSKARNEHSSFYRILDSLMLTHTFVFLGCGITDPDIQLCLENFNFSFPNCRPHYMITSEGSLDTDIQNCLSKNRNLHFLTYENEDRTHSQLLRDLKNLEELVVSERERIAETATW